MANEGIAEEGDLKGLLRRIEELEGQNAELAAKNVTLRSETTTLRVQSDALTADLEKMRKRLADTDEARPKVTLNQLGSQIRQALGAIEEAGDSPGRYVAKRAEFELKGAFDSEDGELALRLPGLTQQVDPGLLGSLRIEMTGGDTGEVDISDLVLVPTLLGMNETGAEHRLASAGLVVGERTESESVRPTGTIIGQDPAGGSYVPPGTAIDIVAASTGVTVPNVVGRNVEGAALDLRRRDLAVGDIVAREADATAGTVLAQDPKAGSTVERGTAIVLTIAKEKAVQVPEVLGAKFDEAKKLLKSMALRAGPVNQTPSEKPQGTVLDQDPEAGTPVAPNSSVALVTAGPRVQRARPMPDVIGIERLAAVEKLTNAGLAVRAEAEARRGEIIHGTFDTVSSQAPAAGAMTVDSVATIKVVASAHPCTAVRGVGPKAATALRGAKITTVGTMAFASPAVVANALSITTDRATALIAAAGDVNDAGSLEAIDGINRSAALALVEGAGIHRPDDLAEQDPAALARTLQAARRNGIVGSGLTLDRPTVTNWVKAAQQYTVA